MTRRRRRADRSPESAAAMTISPLVRLYLFRVGLFDPLALMGAIAVILALSMAASYLPA
jgi:hypothetical protein